ncbi:MAG: alpha/beta hydrolase family protein [Gemmatimonadales bacterium]
MQTNNPDRSILAAAALLGAIVLALTFLGVTVLGAQGPTDRGAFIVRINGTDTLAIERFTRSADSLQGSLSVKNASRVEYVMTFLAPNVVRALSMNVFRTGATPDEAPSQRISLTMRGDSVVADVQGVAQRLATKPRAVPAINLSFAIFETFTRRARAAGGTTEEQYFAVNGGVTLPVTIRPEGPDTLIATINGQVHRFRADATGRILGGALPSQKLEIFRVDAATASRLAIGKPDYSAPPNAPYTAEEVALKGPGGIPLGGTLTLPKNATGRVPAIVTITGSGQQDRDEYIPVAGGYRPFRQLADTLGRRGIAVLRLDDRTVGASGGAIGTSADYADDIRAALAYLRTRPEIDGARLGLAGHSEGGMIAPLVASTDPRLKGIVLFAGPAYNGLDIIRFQQKNLVDHDTSIAPAKRDSALKAVTARFDSAAGKDVWLKFFLTYDPVATARKVRVPALILQGRTDQQVTYEQAEKLGAAMRSGGNKDVTIRVFPEMNHLFIHDPDGAPTGYSKLPTNKMDAAALGAAADWLVLKLGVKTSM